MSSRPNLWSARKWHTPREILPYRLRQPACCGSTKVFMPLKSAKRPLPMARFRYDLGTVCLLAYLDPLRTISGEG